MTKDSTVKSLLANIPKKPGVYLYFDENKTVIYVGKAINLRNRVRSYFQSSRNHDEKTITLVQKIVDIEWIVVGSEVEALITEANLIKKYRPKYNISLKDDKSFPFIRITNEPYPQVFLTRNIVKDGSKYFGPYTDVGNLRRSLKAVRQVFPIRSCTFYLDQKIIDERKVKLCLDYHIQKCEGPCEGLVSHEEYQKMIHRIIKFLQGDTKETEDFIIDAMNAASKDLRFEDAARMRDQHNSILKFKSRQRKIAADFTDRDVFALDIKDNYGFLVVLRIRQGRLFSMEKLALNRVHDNIPDILRNVVIRFYLETDFIPKEISLPDNIEDQDNIKSWLRNKRKSALSIITPKRGEKAREIRVATQNAKLLLGNWLLERKKRKELIPKMVAQLQEDLQLKAPPRRIEAFDISHLGGENTVASMVCFLEGKPRKSEYRKFMIKTVDGIDDFASIKEAVERRYTRVLKENLSLPDLILIDGGKGQLSTAFAVMVKLGIEYIPVIGLAKRLEEVFVPGNSDPQSINKRSPGLILLRRIRDEAHRFAITFQRQKRGKAMITSIFEEIKGMGKKRVEKLLKSFSNLEEIAIASPEEIFKKTGIPVTVSREIINKLKK